MSLPSTFPAARTCAVVATFAALAALGCATTGSGALVSPGGRLQLTNETQEEVEVCVRGDRVAILAPGQTKDVDRLLLGTAQLDADGRSTGEHITTELELEASSVAHWVIRPTAAEAAAIAARPTGVVRVMNLSGEPVRVFIDGEARTMVWPGGTGEFAGVLTGVHRARAEGVRTGFGVDADVAIGAGAITVFTVVPPRGAVRIVNESGLTTRIGVEGITVRRLDNGEATSLFNLAAGSHDIVATDPMGRTVWAGRMTVKPGVVVDAVIPTPPGVLAVVSDLKVPVTVQADGRKLGSCPAGGAFEYRGLPIGTLRLKAVGPDGVAVARARIAIPADGQATWMVKPGSAKETVADEGSILVLNRTRDNLRLRVDGWDRGQVRAGGKRVILGLAPGNHLVAALAARARDVLRADVEVGAGAQVTWEARSVLATLSLKNPQSEGVRVLLDGVELGELAPAQAKEFKVAGGRHALESRGVDTLSSNRQTIDVPPAVTLPLVLEAPLATLVVTNRHNEPLSIAYGDRDLGVILPGDRVTLKDVRPGAYALVAKSLKRPLSWTESVTLRAGDVYKWDLQQ